MPTDLDQMNTNPSWTNPGTGNNTKHIEVSSNGSSWRFRTEMDGVFRRQGDRRLFPAYIGDEAGLKQFNSSRKDKLRIPKETAAVSAYRMEPDSTLSNAGIYIDISKVHRAVEQDSARARELIRDAMLHEFAHLQPVAASRHARDKTATRRPCDPRAAQHPVIQGENRLRGLFGLEPKAHYGLLTCRRVVHRRAGAHRGRGQRVFRFPIRADASGVANRNEIVFAANTGCTRFV
jgi:hypothetical protein